MLRIANEDLATKYKEFCTNVLNRPHGLALSSCDLILLRNLKVMRITALFVFLTNVFWVLKNLTLPTDEKLYEGIYQISGYVHLFLSWLMTIVAYITNRVTDKNRGFINCLFLLFYVYTIFHVALYTINFDNRAMLAGAEPDFVGVAVTTFYLFVIAFAPLDEWYYSLMFCILVVIGFFVPLFHTSAAYYAVADQVILRIFLIAAYLLIRFK